MRFILQYNIVVNIFCHRNGYVCGREFVMQQVNLITTEGKIMVALSGDIDSAVSEDFYAQIDALYKSGKKSIILECSALEFIDSTTLGTLVKIHKQLKADGHVLTLVNVPPRIRKLFEICSLDSLLEIK